MNDAFDDLVDDEEDSEQPDPPAKNPAEVRLDREKAKLKKEVEDLRAWKTEREQADKQKNVSETFQAIGLNPKWSTFYQGEETTPEAVKAWAVANDFIQVSADDAEPAAPTSTGFTPTVIEGSTPAGSKTYSFEEWEGLLQSAPDRAWQVWNDGRVQKEQAPGGSSFVGRDK